MTDPTRKAFEEWFYGAPEKQHARFPTHWETWQAATAHHAQRERELVKEMRNALACFDAAYAEGLLEVLAEIDDAETGSLKDLVCRRLLFAQGHIEAALSTTQQSEDNQ